MDTHKNARLTPKGREEMVRAVADRGMSKAAAAHQFNTTPKTVGKWVDRFCAEGVDGLRDRSSRPLSSPNQIPLATADAVLTYMFENVLEVLDHQVNGCDSMLTTVRAEVASCELSGGCPFGPNQER